MKFSLYDRKHLTGADLAVRIFQTASLLPIIYLFTVTGNMALITKKGVLSALFDYGMSVLPRAEALLLSLLYRKTENEILVYFVLLGAALLGGITASRLLKKEEKSARRFHIVLCVFLGADLILRLLPFSFNGAFGVPAAAVGIAFNILCLALTVLDMKKKQ